MATIFDQVQSLSRAITAMQGIEPIDSLEGSGSIEERIGAIENAVNQIGGALEQLRNSPSANIPEGEELELLVPIPDLVAGNGISLSNVGTGLEISVIIDDDAEASEGTGGDNPIPSGQNDGDMLYWLNGEWTLVSTSVKQLVLDVTYSTSTYKFEQDVQNFRVIDVEDSELTTGLITSLVDCTA